MTVPFSTVLFQYTIEHALFEYSQDSPACRCKSCMKIKMSIDHWSTDIDKMSIDHWRTDIDKMSIDHWSTDIDKMSIDHWRTDIDKAEPQY